MDPNRINEFDELLGALRDGALTDEQVVRLDELLASDAEARDYYIDFIQLATDLKRYHGAGHRDLVAGAKSLHASVFDGPGKPGYEDFTPATRTHLRLIGGFLAMAAAVAVIASLLTLRLIPRTAGNGAEMSSGDGVAVLTRVADAKWGKGSMPAGVGDALAPGRLMLESGLAQIEFYTGAAVVLEGPAELEIVSAERGVLRSGKARAHVPPQAHGFTLQAPGVDVVDLGTEFGLSVDAVGQSEVHVFDGEVRLEGKDPASEQRLTTGQAMRLTHAGGKRVMIDADARSFVDPAGLAGLADRGLRDRRAAWLDHSLRLSQDPAVLLYHTFEGQRPWDRTLENRVAGGTTNSVSAIVGARWSDGRWPGKAALEFKRSSDRVRIDVPGSHAAVTFAAWARFDGFDREWNSLMLTDGWESGEPHWQVSQAGEIILGVKLETGGVNFYSPKGVLGQSDLGRWVHLVTVFDSATGRATHYIDGHAVETTAVPLGTGVTPESMRTPLTIGKGEIGNWAAWNDPSLDADPRTIRNLNGRIDEFTLFGRPLTPPEVHTMYEAGRPHL